jgi:hypothetical protein
VKRKGQAVPILALPCQRRATLITEATSHTRG